MKGFLRPATAGVLLGMAISVVVAPVFAHADSVVASVRVTATILSNLSVQVRSNLAFGSLSTGARPGALVLDPDGNRRASGGVTVQAGATSSPADFLVFGMPRAGFSISAPAVLWVNDSQGHKMRVDRFRISSGSVSTFDATGRRRLNMGATLHVQANQPEGPYMGLVNISVHYN
jgi:hypothetical protein